MSTGQSPSLMFDVASSTIRERQRFARERAQTDTAQRDRPRRMSLRRR